MTEKDRLDAQTAQSKGLPPQALHDASSEALPAPDRETVSAGERRKEVSPQLSMSPGDVGSSDKFADSVHQYVREYIRLADQKAAFLFTGATALLAFLYKNGGSSRWLKPIMEWNILDTITFIAMTGLAVGVLLALLVVRPRTSGSRRGYLFWEAIAEYESARQYADEVMQLTPATLAQTKAEHCFDLARVCRSKYKMLRAAMWVGAVGLAASLCVFLFV